MTMRKYRVVVRPGGVIVPASPQGACRPDDEAWWRDVLWDRRARIPVQRYIEKGSPNAGYRIDRQPLDVVEALCPCGIRRVFKLDMLMKLEPDTNVIWAVRELMNCGRKNKVTNTCQAYVAR